MRASVLRLRPLLAACLLGSLLGLGVAAEARGTGTASGLARRLEARLAKARLRAGRYGVVVLSRGLHPEVLFAAGSGNALVPASAAKLLTAASALDHLGPGHVFRTLVSARGPVSAEGVLAGDLVVHGSGDPNLSGRLHDGNAMAVPTALAEQVFAAGIRRVQGDLVLDERPFDRDYVHADWSAADRTHWYGAPVGGLSFNDACIDVEVAAGAAGSRPGVHLPATAGPWRVTNSVQTVAGASSGVGARWSGSGDVLEVYGRLPPRGRASFSVPVPDPALFFGGALQHALDGQGVRLDGRVRHRGEHESAGGERPVALVESDLPTTLKVMNTRSQNVYAGMLFKLAGAQVTGEASWASGGEAVRAMLERRRIADGGSTRMLDGSGLSPHNAVSAGVLAQMLQAFDRDALRGPPLYDSLPVSGESGTLERRLREAGVRGRVHAKTGTLNDTRARALAGYVDPAGDDPGCVFAILLNGPGASHAVIDDLVREICR